MADPRLTELRECIENAGWSAEPKMYIDRALAICDSLKPDAQIAALQATNQRLADLVRYERHTLHETGLISDEEYAEILQNPGAVDRLEGYDAAQREIGKLHSECARLIAERDAEYAAVNKLGEQIQRLTAERDAALAKLADVEQANRLARDIAEQAQIERDAALADKERLMGHIQKIGLACTSEDYSECAARKSRTTEAGHDN